jgi:hypothetical protein
VAIGDLNGDGKPDLAVANFGSNTVSVLFGNGDGTFGARMDIGTGDGPYSVAIGDLNRDGKADLVVAIYYSNTVSVLLGNGNGTFGPRTDFGTGSGPRSVAIGDLDWNGTPDLVTANYNSNTVSVLLGNGNGTFAAKTDFGTGRSPCFVAIGDLNGDGAPDLVVANYYALSVSVLLNTGGVVAIEVSLATVSAEPGLVRLEWYASTSGFSATVYRRTETAGWIALGQISADGAGHLGFEDPAVEAGHRYDYRLGIREGGSEHFAAETWVEVPAGVGLALEGLRPNPAAGALVVALSLPSAAPARLELLDVSGRRLLERDLRGLGPGQVLVRLESSAGVQPGLYFLRLSQGGRTLVSRASIMR